MSWFGPQGTATFTSSVKDKQKLVDKVFASGFPYSRQGLVDNRLVYFTQTFSGSFRPTNLVSTHYASLTMTENGWLALEMVR